ncbi:MAG: ATP-binding cassette domain-containing protein, partial [Thermomicrobiales bacterium]
MTSTSLPPATSTPTAAIETFDLTKTYGGSRGIRNVTMRVERGEIFGFLGPNGAGKSTTLRTILGFLRPTSGRAEVLGMDSQHETVAIHRRLGNLPSEFSLEDRMTGEEMLGFFADLRGAREHLPSARLLAERLDADLTRPMRRLSRGNKQKMGIIQALF